MHVILRLLYIVLTYLLVPVVLLHLLWKGFGNRSYWRRIPERFGFLPGVGYENVIWVHAVSVGEVQASAALVRALLERYPERQVLVTTTTPTGSDRVKALFGDSVAHCYAPFDLGWSVQRFLNWCRPRIAIILETELWPNLYHECGERGIALVLASARVSPKSVGRYRALVSLFKKTLSHGIVIAAQTPADAERFISIGASPDRTHVTGNIKYDFEPQAGVREMGGELRQQYAAGRPVWIAASTHSSEEEQVLAAHDEVRRAFPDALLILVPRHPERFDSVAGLIERAGESYVRRSVAEASDADTAVLLVDTMGELMGFYAAADVAFVAGSLTRVGGHNLLEPSSLRLPIIVGPHTYNSIDVTELLLAGGVLTVVDDADGLAAAVISLLGDAGERDRRGRKAEALIETSRGALDRLLQLLEPLLG